MISRPDLTKFLRHEDIEGLISTGAPDDEYESEAEMIVDRVEEAESNAPSHKITIEEVEAIINAVWKECSVFLKINCGDDMKRFGQSLRG